MARRGQSSILSNGQQTLKHFPKKLSWLEYERPNSNDQIVVPTALFRGNRVMGIEAIVHVVDDDVHMRQSLAFLLAAAGFAVRVHDSAASLLEEVTEASSGCIV